MTDEATDGGVSAHRRDRVGAVGALVALAGCTLLSLVDFRVNRIVAGTPQPLGAGGPFGWALLVFAAAALVASLFLRDPVRARAGLACAVGMFASLAWALGHAASHLAPDPAASARVSIGGGAWLAAAGAAIVWFAALQSGPARRWRVGAVAAVAGAWIASGLWGGLGRLSIALEYAVQSGAFWGAVGTHLALAGVSLVLAMVIGLPLGVLSARVAWVRAPVLGFIGIIQTVPSLALLGLLVVPLAALGLPGIGPLPAVIALTLYALLPVVRNTYIGLSQVDPAVVDAGRGMGMSPAQLLLRVEAPLALPLFVEGVRAAAVLIIGITAVVAFIGVGTLGVLVFLGWGQQADDLTLLGAVPMVLLAVAADTGLRAIGRAVTSPGISMEGS